MNKFWIVVVVLLGINTTYSQQEVTWIDLSDVRFEMEYNLEYDDYFLAPIFGKNIRAVDGKEVKITGYFLDIAGNGEMFLLSANPMATCFFCGGAGPESIVEVNFNEPPPFVTDQVVQITGTLKLNAEDVEHCNYIMYDASGKSIY